MAAISNLAGCSHGGSSVNFGGRRLTFRSTPALKTRVSWPSKVVSKFIWLEFQYIYMYIYYDCIFHLNYVNKCTEVLLDRPLEQCYFARLNLNNWLSEWLFPKFQVLQLFYLNWLCFLSRKIGSHWKQFQEWRIFFLLWASFGVEFLVILRLVYL